MYSIFYSGTQPGQLSGCWIGPHFQNPDQWSNPSRVPIKIIDQYMGGALSASFVYLIALEQADKS